MSENAPLIQTEEQVAVDALRSRIVSGELKPGTPLQEKLLAEQLGVSRNVVRVVLLTLQERGLVTRERNHTAVVVKLDLRGIAELLDIRESLEGLCVRLAVENSPPGYWQTMVELFRGPMKGYAANGDYHAYLEGIIQFREETFNACASSTLQGLLRGLNDRSRVIIDKVILLPGRMVAGCEQLTRVVTAMRRGDALKAELLRRSNIRSQLEYIRKFETFLL